MKKLLLLLLCVPLIFSCGENTEKNEDTEGEDILHGTWSEAEKNEAFNDCVSSFEHEPSVSIDRARKFCNCQVEEVMLRFPSRDVGRKELLKMSSQEKNELIRPCFQLLAPQD
jgi:hypothetical protein